MIATLNPILSAKAEAPNRDPVFALIDEHRAAYAAWAPLAATWNNLLLTDPAYPAAEEAERVPGERERAALAALMTACPTTLAGVLALAEYLPGAIQQVATDEETEAERALRTIAVALRGFVLPSVEILAPDPVLAAIAASRRAQAEMETFIAETREHPRLGPADREREGLISTAQIGTDAAVWTTVPTTRAGRAALVDYARFQAQVRTAPDGEIDDAEGFVEEILSAFSAAIAAELVLPKPNEDDAQALALVDAIEHAWAEDIELRQWPYGSADTSTHDRQPVGFLRRDALIDAADRLSAETRAGRHAKLLVLAWFNRIETWRPGFPHDRTTRDGRLMGEIETALTAMINVGDQA